MIAAAAVKIGVPRVVRDRASCSRCELNIGQFQIEEEKISEFCFRNIWLGWNEGSNARSHTDAGREESRVNSKGIVLHFDKGKFPAYPR